MIRIRDDNGDFYDSVFGSGSASCGSVFERFDGLLLCFALVYLVTSDYKSCCVGRGAHQLVICRLYALVK